MHGHGSLYSPWHSDERGNAYGAAGVSIFGIVAVLTSAVVGEAEVLVAIGAGAWIAASVVVWALLRHARAATLLVWPVLLSTSILGLSLVSPTAAALLVGAQTLGFVFAGQTNPPGRFVVLLPAAWASAWLSFDLPVRESLIRVAIATLIWAVCAEIPARLLARLDHLATTDPLTGLSNRTQMYRVLDGLDRRSAASRSTPAFVLIDLDHFKDYNDSAGHLAGDELLAEFGHCITTGVRGTDLACRFGGEEFLLVLDEVTLDQATALVDRLRQSWALTSPACTFSAGVATTLRQADDCLYRAKDGGRDRTVTADAPHGTAPLPDGLAPPGGVA